MLGCVICTCVLEKLCKRTYRGDNVGFPPSNICVGVCTPCAGLGILSAGVSALFTALFCKGSDKDVGAAREGKDDSGGVEICPACCGDGDISEVTLCCNMGAVVAVVFTGAFCGVVKLIPAGCDPCPPVFVSRGAEVEEKLLFKICCIGF